MTTVYLDCPKCDDELEFECETDSADDGVIYRAGICYEQNCQCNLTDSEIEVLEQEATEKYIESIFNYEP